MSSKKTKIKLPTELRKVRIRYHKNKYPDKSDIIVAKIKKKDANIGYYMDMIEYENKEALIVYKEVCKSARKKYVFNTFNEEVNYPLVVSERIIKRIHENSEFQTDSEGDSDNDNISDSEDINLNDPTIDVKIDLTNRTLSESEKKEAMFKYAKYKQIHNVLHTYGALLKQSTIQTQEEADSINDAEYKDYLETLAESTIWKYPRDETIEIFNSVRNNMDLYDNYFDEGENNDIFKQAIIKGIPKTKYQLTCMLKMQTLDINGINIIRNALDTIMKSGITTQIISAPEYLLKLEMTDMEKLEQKMNDAVLKTTQFMGNHMGFVQITKCQLSNNLTDDVKDYKLPFMQMVV